MDTNDSGALAILFILLWLASSATPEKTSASGFLEVCESGTDRCEPGAEVEYRVFADTQTVVSRAGIYTTQLKHCVVFNVENWTCGEVEAVQGMNDGEYVNFNMYRGPTTHPVGKWRWRYLHLRTWLRSTGLSKT